MISKYVSKVKIKMMYMQYSTIWLCYLYLLMKNNVTIF